MLRPTIYSDYNMVRAAEVYQVSPECVSSSSPDCSYDNSPNSSKIYGYSEFILQKQ